MNQHSRKTMLLVDDHPFICLALRTFLNIILKDVDIVGEAHNGREAIRLCDELSPDIVLMDIIMPCLDGIEATRLILEDHPTISVIGLTSLDSNDSLVQQLIDAGAVSYIHKQASAEEIVEVFQACGVLSSVTTKISS